MMSDNIKTVLTKEELATILRVSTRTLERHLRDKDEGVILWGKWKAYRIGRHWRFEELVLQEA